MSEKTAKKTAKKSNRFKSQVMPNLGELETYKRSGGEWSVKLAEKESSSIGLDAPSAELVIAKFENLCKYLQITKSGRAELIVKAELEK